MKTKYVFGFFILLFLGFLAGCSSPKEATKDTQQIKDTTMQAAPDTLIGKPASIVKDSVYIVQIGAFNTEAKALAFSDEAQKKIKREIVVKFSSSVNLFVVQLAPFNTKREAEEFRNDLWRQVEYSDAFIVTEEK